MARGILGLGVLLALAVLSSWFLATLESTLDIAARSATAPPLTMSNVQAMRMTAEGVREYTIATPTLVQLPDDGGTQLSLPRVDVYRDGTIRDWLLRAEDGWIAPDNDLIRLQRTVTLVRPAVSGRQPVVITTRDVAIHPDLDLVEGAAPVRIQTPQAVVEAVGFRVFVQEDRLELLNDVRGSYVPANP